MDTKSLKLISEVIKFLCLWMPLEITLLAMSHGPCDMGCVFIQLHIPHVICLTMDYSQLIEPIFTHTETVVPFCVFLDFNFIVHFINIWSVQEAVQTAVQAIDFIKSIPNGIPSSVAHLNIKFSFRSSQHHNITDAASDIRSIYRFQWIRSISGSVSAIQNSSRIWKSVNITGILLSLKISDFFDLIISSHPENVRFYRDSTGTNF